MKKWLYRIGFVLFILLAVLLLVAAWSETDSANMTSHRSNPDLSTIKPEWPGTPVDQEDRFMNHEFPFLPSSFDLLKWKLGGNQFAEAKSKDTHRLEVKDPSKFLRSDRDGILWLGHASFFIRINGVSILTDPLFGKPPVVQRFVEVPSPLEHIQKVDYVLLSHDHRDHMDESTLRDIAAKFPNATFLAGLRSDDVLSQWKTPTNPVQMSGWFQEYRLNDQRIKMYFVPVRHWSRRGLFDTNWRLWGGFILQTEKTTIYFGGDSGYGRHYREAAELFPKIDYFIIGIGAYEPRWFMEANHNNPSDAVKGFIDSKAHYLIPMHYGTFDLSDEPPSQPLRFLMEEAEKAGIQQKIRPLAINEALPVE